MAPRDQNKFTYDELISCAKGEMFGPGNPQLPLPPMLMCDRITNIQEAGGLFDKGEIDAEFDLNPDLWFFPCHFDGDPVMPGCLGMDALWQLVGFSKSWTSPPHSIASMSSSLAAMAAMAATATGSSARAGARTL